MKKTTLKRSPVTDIDILIDSRIKFIKYEPKTKNIIVENLDFDPHEIDLFHHIACKLHHNTFLYIPDEESLDLLYSFMDNFVSEHYRVFYVGLNCIENECYSTIDYEISDNENKAKPYLDRANELQEIKSKVLQLSFIEGDNFEESNHL